MTITAEQQVKHFLETGEYDPLPTGWADDCMTSVKRHNQAMREALITETRRRAKGISVLELPVLNHIEHTRNKVTPMVNGLFPQSERANVLNSWRNLW